MAEKKTMYDGDFPIEPPKNLVEKSQQLPTRPCQNSVQHFSRFSSRDVSRASLEPSSLGDEAKIPWQESEIYVKYGDLWEIYGKSIGNLLEIW